MILETFKNFPDFELLDTGYGYRLERWGEVILQRPDPQVIWPRSLADTEWNKAWAVYKSGSADDKGKWEIKKAVPEPWIIEFQMNADKSARYIIDGVKFLLKLSPFKHTGLFAEQAGQWEWMAQKLSSPSSHKVIKSGTENNLKILNLFGYTGGATMVLAKMGCFVTHVDASKPAITWANENYKLNFGNVGADTIRPPTSGKMISSPTPGVRWILDDAVKFVKRELKRGAKYDGIIMDPPAFGHSPTGKTWKFNDDLPGLLADSVRLLSPDAKFLIINAYATNSSALSLNNVLEDAISSRGGKIEFGELCLKQKFYPVPNGTGAGRQISTGIFSRWSLKNI